MNIGKPKGTLLVAAAWIVLVSCTQKGKELTKTSDDDVAVEVWQIGKASLSNQINSAGVLASKAEIKLGFKTGGMIKRMYVNEGQFVKAGQLLAELDMSEIEAQVNQAKIALQKANRDYNRIKKLYDDEAATELNLQDAHTGFEMATQTVQAALFNQKLSRIYAPVAGRILRKVAEQGELIVPFAPALLLGTTDAAFVVTIGLSDKDLVKIQIGNPADIELDAYPGEVFRAKVTQIAQAVNPVTGTFEVELQLSPSGHTLASGFVAKATLFPNQDAPVLVLPIEAIVEVEGNEATVFVYDELKQEARMQKVKIGNKVASQVAIQSGLVANQQVITKGAGFLVDHQKVKVADL
jgi:RND family efflux transporter MFP subunit